MACSKLYTAAEVNKQIMDAALSAVKNGGMSQNSVAKAYGISRSTLRNRLQNRHTGRHGGKTKFPPALEKELVELLKACCDMGIPLSRYHCYQLFSQVAIDLGKSDCRSHLFEF